MGKDEKDLLETYRDMTPENKATFLAMIHAAHAGQENARKRYERPVPADLAIPEVTA
ncbi:hypothetical protein FACS1894110_18310 [Spirochaetia bacterium]|nr:hypothetical protein FACS1894110_18310 [Spirochaetia bacterium]